MAAYPAVKQTLLGSLYVLMLNKKNPSKVNINLTVTKPKGLKSRI